MLRDKEKRKKYDTYGPEMEEINQRHHAHRDAFGGRIFLNLSHEIYFSFFLVHLLTRISEIKKKSLC